MEVAPKRVCVVGAGPAGLVSTKTLVEAGLEVDCFEMSSETGGHWVLDNPNGRSAAYHSLRTNTPKSLSRFSDFEMPEEWPDFPSHTQVRLWFESYIDTFGFRERIQTRHEVVAARPVDPEGWDVEVRGESGQTSTERYDALLATSGSYWHPRLPEIPGELGGKLMHARQYRDPKRPFDVRGKRVVVVGIGNTGCEVACEIAQSGARAVRLSARSGRWILPRLADGRPAVEAAPMTHPCDPVPALFRALPEPWRQPLFVRMSEQMLARRLGDLQRRYQELGLPPAPGGALSKRPTVSEELLGCLERGEIVARPAIERFEGPEVVFVDGTREPADLVLCATGYHLDYPYLDRELIDTRDDDLELFLGTLHPRRHDLFIVGVSRPAGAFWPIAEVHAQFAAALIAGRYEPPKQFLIDQRASPILKRKALNPALYGLAVRQELRKGGRRAVRTSLRTKRSA